MAMRRKVSVSMDRSDELKSKQNINKLLLNESLPSQITDSAIVSEIISRLEMKYSQLSLRYQQLSTKFEKIDELAQEAVWQYSVTTSNDFRCIPLMVTDLVKNESRIGEYGVEKVLRKGAYSTVKCCIKCEGSEQTITKYVVKTIPKENIHHIANAIMVNTEIRALMTLSGHMGVVGFVEAIHTPSHVHIATEWFPCDLFEFMSAHHSALNEKIVSVIMRKLLLGVEFLHSHRIVHRDIKPENILIAFNNQKEIFVKICDFGLCEFMPSVSVTASVQGVCGSRGFFAPESITCSAGYCGFKADLFSVGCVCLEMLASPAFFSAQWMAAYEAAATFVPECYLYEKAIHRVILKAAQEMSARHPLCVSEFIAGALNILPAARFNLTEMMFCRWLCVAERLEKPSNIGAHFDFMNPNSVGRVSGTYAPTANCSDSECLRAMREFSVAKDKTMAVKQHSAESETSAEKLITLRDKILRSDSHNRSPLTGCHRSGLELDKSPVDSTLSDTDGDAESCGDGSSYSSVASSVSRPDSDESSLMAMAMKRVALPGTHIILSPLAATSSSLTSTEAAKMLPHHTNASARQSPSVSFDQNEVGSPGKKILSAVRTHNLPTKQSAVRGTQTSSKSPPRNSSESCPADTEAAHITMLDRNQQYLSQDSVTGIKFAPVNKPAPPRITAAQLSDESADTSCGYLAQLEHQAARDAYRPTQAFERIQARMMLRDGDYHSEASEPPATKRVPHLPTPAKEKDVNLYNCTMKPGPPKPVSVSKPGSIAGTQRHKAGQPIRFG